MKKFFIILLAFILVASIGVGIFFGFKYKSNIKNTISGWFNKDKLTEEEIDYKELYEKQLESNGDLNLKNFYLSTNYDKVITENIQLKSEINPTYKIIDNLNNYSLFSALLDDTYTFSVNSSTAYIQGSDITNYTLGEIQDIINSNTIYNNVCLKANKTFKIIDKIVNTELQDNVIYETTIDVVLVDSIVKDSLVSININIDYSSVDFSPYGEVNSSSAYLNFDKPIIDYSEKEGLSYISIKLNALSVREWGSI